MDTKRRINRLYELYTSITIPMRWEEGYGWVDQNDVIVRYELDADGEATLLEVEVDETLSPPGNDILPHLSIEERWALMRECERRGIHEEAQ